jgi:hypothetical protein
MSFKRFTLACPSLPMLMWSCATIWLRDVDDLLRHLDVGTRRRRVSARMIVHQTTRRVTALIDLIFPIISTSRGRGLGAVSVSDFSSSSSVVLTLGRSILITLGH